MILFQIALLPYLLLGVIACWHAHRHWKTRGTAVFSTAAHPAAQHRTTLFRTRAGVFFRRHLAVPSLLAVGWMWFNGTGLAIPLYDRMLRVAHWSAAPTRPFTTIVLLGGGTELTGPRNAPRPQGDSIEKIALTARLYHAASASRARADNAPAAPLRVVISGGNPQHHGVTEADNYAPDLVALGVPSAAIVRERRSLNTYQNAKFVREMLPVGGSNPIVLVTRAQHMRRALLYFERFGFDVQPVTPPPVPPPPPTWLPTVRGFSNAVSALHELIGIVQFHVYHALRIY